jgi:hypothetical protein
MAPTVGAEGLWFQVGHQEPAVIGFIAHGLALLQLGCELAQGYGIARPMAASDIPEWASNWKADDSWLAQGRIEASRTGDRA